ncbi:hypothetical protein PGTUg99_002321 [Puccinia graminis f. sp. tritici]|uniref:Secreted protein n=1 Tax=Puccinia graminis f. sp. tritici TaxID=56615 RepID=A0A5B0M030_PUCGR|nr:hypothetical protein PGTUg99_002321 [Puccinia graminis f. sp. tritici]
MNAALYALLCLAAASANVAGVGEKMQCSTYAAAGYKGYTCNDRSDIICTEGCKKFITITNCTLSGHPQKPATTELCTVAYGRNTAAAKGSQIPFFLIPLGDDAKLEHLQVASATQRVAPVKDPSAAPGLLLDPALALAVFHTTKSAGPSRVPK